jgi:hypothetical protein
MPGYNSQRLGTANTLPNLLFVFFLLFVLSCCQLWCSIYCLCVNVHCHRVSTQLQLTYISISIYIICSPIDTSFISSGPFPLGMLSLCLLYRGVQLPLWRMNFVPPRDMHYGFPTTLLATENKHEAWFWFRKTNHLVSPSQLCLCTSQWCMAHTCANSSTVASA